MKIHEILSRLDELGKEIDRHRVVWQNFIDTPKRRMIYDDEIECYRPLTSEERIEMEESGETPDRDDLWCARRTVKSLKAAKAQVAWAMGCLLDARDSAPDVGYWRFPHRGNGDFDPAEGMAEIEMRVKIRRRIKSR